MLLGLGVAGVEQEWNCKIGIGMLKEAGWKMKPAIESGPAFDLVEY